MNEIISIRCVTKCIQIIGLNLAERIISCDVYMHLNYTTGKQLDFYQLYDDLNRSITTYLPEDCI